jgi:hypothetical protein
MFQTIVDGNCLLHDRTVEEYSMRCRDIVVLSSYLTSHVKRFSDYIISLHVV